VGEGRGYYRHNFTRADLRAMAQRLRSLKGLWVLKLTDDNYALIKDILPPHEVREVRKTLFMKQVEEGEEKPDFKIVIAYNYKAERLM